MSNTSLSQSQEIAYDALLSERNLFITGGAGSGKSFLIRYFYQDRSKDEFPLLASTGVASILIGGRTFHSFMGLGIMEGGEDKTVERALKDKALKRRLKKIKGFVLDEVSMISGVVFRTAERICRETLDPNRVWGGLRVITVGDFAQLPPVGAARDWCFQDYSWQNTGFSTFKLSGSQRSQQAEFNQLLNSVRIGNLSAETIEFLDSRRVSPPDEATRLFPRRQQTEAYNLQRLQKIDAQEHEFESVYSGLPRFVNSLKKSSPIPEKIVLKEGALVMLRQNDPMQRYVNGSLGNLVKIKPDSLSIELLNGRNVQVSPTSFGMQNADGETVAAVTNFPINLAYASTIHKSQGSTLDKVIVDLKNLWEPGQAYVALSRAQRLEDIYILDWQRKSIFADPMVQSFYNDL